MNEAGVNYLIKLSWPLGLPAFQFPQNSAAIILFFFISSLSVYMPRLKVLLYLRGLDEINRIEMKFYHTLILLKIVFLLYFNEIMVTVRKIQIWINAKSLVFSFFVFTSYFCSGFSDYVSFRNTSQFRLEQVLI